MPADTRRLIQKVSLLLFAILFTGAVVSRFNIETINDEYLAAVQDKDALIRRTPSPKIILVGGSNLAFGIDSHMVEDSLKINVVNMGLYAKLGLRYMLAQATPYIKKGDVLVVVPEYDQFYGDYSAGDNTLTTALLYTPADRIGDFIKSYSVIDVVFRPRAEQARRAFLHLAAASIGAENEYFPADTNPVYNRHSFDDRGDMVGHLNLRSTNPDSIAVHALPALKTFSPATIDGLNSASDAAKRVGAKSYFMFPSFMERAWGVSDKSVDSLVKRLQPELKMPFVGTPKDFVFADTLFFNTRYHLNRLGREIRTKRMIDLLGAAGVKDGWLPHTQTFIFKVQKQMRRH